MKEIQEIKNVKEKILDTVAIYRNEITNEID
jgi:hypothetical protein